MSVLTVGVKLMSSPAHKALWHSQVMLSDRIKATRIAAGLSQSELARLCKVTPSAINKLERSDTKSLSGELLLALSQALSVSAAWLETGRGNLSKKIDVSIRESELLALFRELTETNKEAALSVCRSLHKTQIDTPSTVNPYIKV